MAHELTPTYGIEGGSTVQFAEGVWPQLGDGVAIDEEVGLDLVMPLLLEVVPGFGPADWYSTFQVSTWIRAGLIGRLRSEAAKLLESDPIKARSDLLTALADWLEARDGRSITFVGI